MTPNHLCTLKKEKSERDDRDSCVWDLPSDSSCKISERHCKTGAFGPDLCPGYHKEHVESVSHRL